MENQARDQIINSYQHGKYSLQQLIENDPFSYLMKYIRKVLKIRL